MQWADAIENINYLSVVAGVAVSLLIGFVWYEPRVFGEMWGKLVGLKKKDMQNKDGMPVMMAASVIFYTVVSVTIALLHEITGGSGLGDGMLLGLIVGFAFGFGPMATTYLYARRQFELTMIDGGYIFVTTALIGAIVGHLA